MSVARDIAPCAVRPHAVRSSHSNVWEFLTALLSTAGQQNQQRCHKESLYGSSGPLSNFVCVTCITGEW